MAHLLSKEKTMYVMLKWKVRICLLQAWNYNTNVRIIVPCYKGDNLSNKRTEILGTCRHRNKYKLKIYDSKYWRHKSIS